jgi:hypothetical protein
VLQANEAAKAARATAISASVALQPLDVDLDENVHPAALQALEAAASLAADAARAVIGDAAIRAERDQMRQQGGNVRAYAAALRAYTTRWNAIGALSPEDRQLLASVQPSASLPPSGTAGKILAAQALVGGLPQPGFSATGFIAAAAKSGVTLSVVNGKLVAAPKGMLAEAARRQLASEANREAVVAALQSTEEV